MAIFVTIALDLVLAFTLLISAQIAAGWGELCGIRPGNDKSGLGGFTMLLMVFVVRWLGLALVLVVTAGAGERWWLLGAHAAVGWLSSHLFQRGVTRVQNDGMVTNVVGFLGSTVIPAPSWTIAVARANASWLGDGATTIAVVASLVVLLHFACYRQRRSSMLASRA